MERIFRELPDEGFIEILRLGDAGLAVLNAPAPRYYEVTISEFTVAISVQVVERVSTLRAAAHGNEIGGILIGSWDRVNNILYVVAATDAPSDSSGRPTEFERGSAGVLRSLERVETITAGNLTYVGEWHSHPPGANTHPSGDDRILLRWIAKNLKFLDVPPCMIISGEKQMRIVVRTHKESSVRDYNDA